MFYNMLMGTRVPSISVKIQMKLFLKDLALCACSLLYEAKVSEGNIYILLPRSVYIVGDK